MSEDHSDEAYYNDPANFVDSACEYFDHPVNKGSPGHMHICTHASNLTMRCGYDFNEPGACPLYEPKDGGENY